ncbi:MAG TPA: FAD-dependent oxidoreductase [Bryobacteraceae bacterium]|jgi:glycine/D-amino acid oxidase-like deaminating enzyme|nr:FAD-dependent oxidoreductase [Bryobacteraceae bacterium]
MGAQVDAVVVGCGIVGAACAYELTLAGLRVTVCEQNDHVGGGATAAGMGHLAVMDDSDAQFALTSYSQQLWQQLASELPRKCEYLDCGSLWIAADDLEYREVQRKFDFYSNHKLPVEVLDTKQVAEAEPNLRPGLAGALLLPSDAVCYPPAVARFLAYKVAAAGGRILLNKTVVSLQDDQVRFADGSALGSDLVVLATGASIHRLVPEIEMRPRKGHLLITDRYPGFVRRQLIELGYLKSAHATNTDSVAFNAQPRMTGQILIGSSRQYGVETPEVDNAILQIMLQKAIQYMPGLENLAALRTWTGFRAATPDKLPLIGKLPGNEHVFLATGHEGLGISTSLATGRLLTDEILGRESAISRLPYQPARNFALHA